jgi:hypothetical protein
MASGKETETEMGLGRWNGGGKPKILAAGSVLTVSN